jgi:glutaredoxin
MYSESREDKMSDTKDPQITIYRTSWCAFCHTEMQWLDALGIPYVAKDIEEDKVAYDELMEKSKGDFRGVPVTDIAGDLVLGFDRPKIQDLIKTHGITPVAA